MRKIAPDHFAAGTTIDGNRVDAALDGMVDRINDVPLGDFHRRHVRVVRHFGYTPTSDPANMGAPIVWRVPFLLTRNDAAGEVIGAGPPAFNAPRRFKGIAPREIAAGATVNAQYAWTVSLWQPRAACLESLAVCLRADAGAGVGTIQYGNTFQYDAAPPPGRSKFDPVDDYNVLVTAADPYAPEDPTRRAVLIAHHQCRASAHVFSQTPAPAVAHPPWPAGPVGWAARQPTGLAIILRPVMVPLPAKTRLRVSLVIPHWVGDLMPWGVYPTSWQRPGMTLVMLQEPIRG